MASAHTRAVFFTVNGRFLGLCFVVDDTPQDVPLWPCVGIDAPWGLSFNFGQRPFRFRADEAMPPLDVRLESGRDTPEAWRRHLAPATREEAPEFGHAEDEASVTPGEAFSGTAAADCDDKGGDSHHAADAKCAPPMMPLVSKFSQRQLLGPWLKGPVMQAVKQYVERNPSRRVWNAGILGGTRRPITGGPFIRLARLTSGLHGGDWRSVQTAILGHQGWALAPPGPRTALLEDHSEATSSDDSASDEEAHSGSSAASGEEVGGQEDDEELEDEGEEEEEARSFDESEEAVRGRPPVLRWNDSGDDVPEQLREAAERLRVGGADVADEELPESSAGPAPH